MRYINVIKFRASDAQRNLLLGWIDIAGFVLEYASYPAVEITVQKAPKR